MRRSNHVQNHLRSAPAEPGNHCDGDRRGPTTRRNTSTMRRTRSGERITRMPTPIIGRWPSIPAKPRAGGRQPESGDRVPRGIGEGRRSRRAARRNHRRPQRSVAGPARRGPDPRRGNTCRRYHRRQVPPRERCSSHNGQSVYCFERDRVLALRLVARALELAEKETDPAGLAELHLAFARILLMEKGRVKCRSGVEVSTPDESRRIARLREVRRRLRPLPQIGAPVDHDGQPVFFHRPATYEAARNDGERWRWHLARCIELDPARPERGTDGPCRLPPWSVRRPHRRLRAASRARSSTTNTTAISGRSPWLASERMRPWLASRPASSVSLFPMSSITSRSTARSPRRSGPWGERALDVLGEAFENRRQYPRAAEIWERGHRAVRTRRGRFPQQASRANRGELG